MTNEYQKFLEGSVNGILIAIVFYLVVPLPDESTSFQSSSTNSIVRITGGQQNFDTSNPSSTNPPTLKFVPALRNQNPGRSVSTSDNLKSSSTDAPYTSLRGKPPTRVYRPSGSGSGGSGGPSSIDNDWQRIAQSPDPDKIIADIDFWDSFFGQKKQQDSCNIEDYDDLFNAEDEENWRQIEIDQSLVEKEQQVPRRKLLANPPVPGGKKPIPTAKLDDPVRKANDLSYSTGKKKGKFELSDQPFPLWDYEGQIITVRKRDLNKNVYAHSNDLDLDNIAKMMGYKDMGEWIECPIQPNPEFFQRTHCRQITNDGKRAFIVELIQRITTPPGVNRNYMKRRIPSPFYSGQMAIGYFDLRKNNAICVHENGDMWGVYNFSKDTMDLYIENLDNKFSADSTLDYSYFFPDFEN